MNPANRVAVALGLDNTTATLEQLQKLEGWIGLAEIRLDLMDEFDLEQLITRSPCPLVVTCRAPREGGSFIGTESERLEILSAASALGCAYVDIEWDCVSNFRNYGESTKVIVSRHFHDSMPGDLWTQYGEMRRQADVVKLVGFARQTLDTLPIIELIVKADSPVIAIAMGAAGLITRLIAPCFDSCLLTYAAANPEAGTAPGQIGVHEMINHFGVDRAGSDTPIEVHLYCDPRKESAAMEICRGDGALLHVPARVDRGHIGLLRGALEGLTPRISVSLFETD